jgi:hypothetical protein
MLKSLFGVEGVPIRSARVEEVRKKKTPSAIHEGFLAVPASYRQPDETPGGEAHCGSRRRGGQFCGREFGSDYSQAIGGTAWRKISIAKMPKLVSTILVRLF